MASAPLQASSLNSGPRLVWLIAGAAGTLALAVVYAFDPSRNAFYPPCVFRALTGLQCPGCGGTRALHALLHGDIAAAWAFNPLLFVAGVAALLIAARPTLLTKPWFAWAAAASLISWGVLRNVFGI